VSTIFIAIALVTAGLAILTVLGALLVLAGVIAIRASEREAAETRLVPRRLVSRGAAAPTLKLDPNEDGARDDTAAFKVGKTAFPPYSHADSPDEARPTEMFGTNAGNFSELIDDVDDRR